MRPCLVKVGQVYGRLTVVAERPERHGANGGRIFECRCECGNAKSVPAGQLRNQHTRSCGCVRRERGRRMLTKHGKASTPEWITWCAMRHRCRDRNHHAWKDYGGRGIAVCDRWESSFEDFLADMGPRPTPKHSIERIDVNGNYEPSNCTWATTYEQSINRRNTHRLTVGDVTLTISQWSQRSGLSKSTIGERLKRGWTVERAVAPLKKAA